MQLLATPAHAQDEKIDRIAYVAPATCPSRGQFLAEVQRRLSDETAALDVGDIAVSIEQSDSVFTGRFHLHDDKGINATRRISGGSCDEVVSALALVTALALQARLSLEDDESAAPEPATEAAAVPPGTEDPSPPSAAAAASANERFEVGLHLGAASAYSSNVSGTVRGFAGLLDGPLSLRLWLGYATSRSAHSALGSASFDWLGTRGDACYSLGDRSALRVGLCGTIEAGALLARGENSGTVTAHSKALPWLAPGLMAQLRQSLGSGWGLEFSGGPQFPLYREQFAFRLANGTLAPIRRVPWAGWVASIGIGYSLR